MEHMTDEEIWEHVLTMTDIEPCLELDDHDLGRFATAAMLLFEKTGYSPLFRISAELFNEFVDRAPVFERQFVYRRIFRIVESGSTRPAVLRWFWDDETEPSLVATAAIDYSVLHVPLSGDPLAGPNAVLNILRKPSTRCRAGLFRGLMLLGDDRVCGLLEPVRRELNEDEIGVVCQEGSGYLCASTIEFLLDWLEEVESEGDDEKYGFIAAGLVNQLRSAKTPVVIRGRRRFPVDPYEGVFEDSAELIPISEYASEIQPVLCSFAEREPPPEVMPIVLAAWDLASSLSSEDEFDDQLAAN